MARRPEDMPTHYKVDGKRVDYTLQERAALAAEQDAAEAKQRLREAAQATQQQRHLVLDNIEVVLAAVGLDAVAAAKIADARVRSAVESLLPS